MNNHKIFTLDFVRNNIPPQEVYYIMKDFVEKSIPNKLLVKCINASVSKIQKHFKDSPRVTISFNQYVTTSPGPSVSSVSTMHGHHQITQQVLVAATISLVSQMCALSAHGGIDPQYYGQDSTSIALSIDSMLMRFIVPMNIPNPVVYVITKRTAS